MNKNEFPSPDVAQHDDVTMTSHTLEHQHVTVAEKVPIVAVRTAPAPKPATGARTQEKFVLSALDVLQLLELFLKELLVLCQQLQLSHLRVLVLQHGSSSPDVSSVVVVVVSCSHLTLIPSLLRQVAPIKLVAPKVVVVVVVVLLTLIVVVVSFEVVPASSVIHPTSSVPSVVQPLDWTLFVCITVVV